ncbi:hypothetical protein O1G21_35005 [Kitasatospora cathayae]|uniref:Uncharacterized protein n=2 Tax=Kitasatospora cathayae TaxID=3004092 RepID=A0ABY7QCW1_9ACTN|nr:hypothetical protein [Kitasatospora sp. HUAS 3-15]WBP90563.1 hypothetical protein O1G21_35005 [Kitasatospora sp. HUAS 3-15]
MAAVTESGGIVMPPVPAFYLRPSSIDEIVEHTAGRALDLLGIDVPDRRAGANEPVEERDPRG